MQSMFLHQNLILYIANLFHGNCIFYQKLHLNYTEANLPNDSLWNVPLYDVIVWISTASAEED